MAQARNHPTAAAPRRAPPARRPPPPGRPGRPDRQGLLGEGGGSRIRIMTGSLTPPWAHERVPVLTGRPEGVTTSHERSPPLATAGPVSTPCRSARRHRRSSSLDDPAVLIAPLSDGQSAWFWWGWGSGTAPDRRRAGCRRCGGDRESFLDPVRWRDHEVAADGGVGELAPRALAPLVERTRHFARPRAFTAGRALLVLVAVAAVRSQEAAAAAAPADDFGQRRGSRGQVCQVSESKAGPRPWQVSQGGQAWPLMTHSLGGRGRITALPAPRA